MINFTLRKAYGELKAYENQRVITLQLLLLIHAGNVLGLMFKEEVVYGITE
jgi:hypothetical protein